MSAALPGALFAAAEDGCAQHEATILFADARGFSAIAAAWPAREVFAALAAAFGRMGEIVAQHYGTVDKFMGDGMMAVFHGEPALPRAHARRALLCAVEMQIALRELRRERRDARAPRLYFGIGISTGTVVSGLVGARACRSRAVIGEEVNVAARLEALSLRGQILMSEATYALCRDFVHAGEPFEVHVKGRSAPLGVREALGIPALGKAVPRQDQRRSPRVALELPVDYQLLAGKQLAAGGCRGTLRDLGYHGALLELERPLEHYAELKLAFELPGAGPGAAEVYARIVSLREQDGRPLAGVEFTSSAAGDGARIRRFVQASLGG